VEQLGGRGTVAGGQVPLASDDWRELSRLERAPAQPGRAGCA